jgi:hypothetical protein
LRSSWDVVKLGFIRMFQQLYLLHELGFSCLNQALLTLLPKRADASRDYMPISLIHLVARVFAKLLLYTLRPSSTNL